MPDLGVRGGGRDDRRGRAADVEARLDGVLSTPRFLREAGDARLVVV